MSIADQALTEDLASRDDMIVCTGVSKWFDDFQALKGVDVTVKDQMLLASLLCSLCLSYEHLDMH